MFEAMTRSLARPFTHQGVLIAERSLLCEREDFPRGRHVEKDYSLERDGSALRDKDQGIKMNGGPAAISILTSGTACP